jgi:hypothetical protein
MVNGNLISLILMFCYRINCLSLTSKFIENNGTY